MLPPNLGYDFHHAHQRPLGSHSRVVFTVILIAKPAFAAVTTLAYVVVVRGYDQRLFRGHSPPILVRRIPRAITVTNSCLLDSTPVLA